MKSVRLAAFVAVASLGFLPGCCCSFGNGEILNRMGLGPRQPSCCDCSTSGAPSLAGCEGPGCQGPSLGDMGGPYLPGAPGVQENLGQPRVVPMPQAQPTPAGPVSTTKLK